jgi:deoxyribose-phosphate aldolase
MPEILMTSHPSGLLPDWRTAAQFIDHSKLQPQTTETQVGRLCEEAVHYGFPTVFVHPWYVPFAADVLRGTKVKLGTPIGFTQGGTLSSVKRFEAEEALRLGAGELDMVINLGALKSGQRDFVQSDIQGVVKIAHPAGVILKVILETALLTREEKILACELSVAAGADFVKTSTGLVGGATVEDVALMRSVVANRARVKASGGVRTASDLAKMTEAGAVRIGTSSGVSIMRELGAPELSP